MCICKIGILGIAHHKLVQHWYNISVYDMQ